MNAKMKTSLIVAAVLLAITIASLSFFLVNARDKKSSNVKKSSSSTTSPPNQKTIPESTIQEIPSTTSKSNISLSLSSPIDGQAFENESVPVRVIIYGATKGTCTATFKQQGSENIVLTANIIQAPTYFTCEGFDVDNSKFTSKGTWNLNVKVDAPNGSSESDIRKIDIK